MDLNSIIEDKKTDITKLFYECLNDDNYIVKNEDNFCYITQDMLKENSIKMQCGHTFNYIPLLNEVKKQKQMKNSYSTLRLRIHQIQCPYCRQIQDAILPLVNNMEKIYGVNYPASYTMKPDTCEFIHKSGKKKGTLCQRACFGTHCQYHKRSLSANTISYCDCPLKSGPRKGKSCGNKVFENGRCKRHLKTK